MQALLAWHAICYLTTSLSSKRIQYQDAHRDYCSLPLTIARDHHYHEVSGGRQK